MTDRFLRQLLVPCTSLLVASALPEVTSGSEVVSLPLKKKRGTTSTSHSLGLTADVLDWWYVEMIFGTPAQGPYKLMVDTGSSSLWVPDSRCGVASCGKKPRFDAAKSSSFELTGEYQGSYGAGPFTARTGKDDVRLLADGFSMFMNFGQATSVNFTADLSPYAGTHETFPDWDWDGILGIGPVTPSVKGSSWVDELPKHGVSKQYALLAPRFSAYEGSPHADGSFDVGGPNPAHYTGELFDSKTTDFTVTKIVIPPSGDAKHGQVLYSNATGLMAAYDTGATVLFPFMFTSSVITPYLKLVKAVQTKAGHWEVDCADVRPLELELCGGFQVTLGAHLLSWPLKQTNANSQRCFLSMIVNDNLRENVNLATPFWETVYAVFDFQKNRARFGVPKYSQA